MRQSGSGVGELAGHRLRPSYFLFPSPAGIGKTTLGGELRREEQLISRTGMCKDRVGTVEDLSEGFFRLPFPPSSGTTGVIHEQRSCMSNSTSTSCPTYMINVPTAAGAGRVSWRIATFYFHTCTCLRACSRRYRYCHWRGWE
jgi:hypothetical protein